MSLLAPLLEPVATIMGMPLSVGDLAGFATGLVCVWLTTRSHIGNFPVGIVNCVILGLVFVELRLFSDAGLQVIFIIMSLIGWRAWLRHDGNAASLPVFRSNGREWLLLALAASLVTLLLRQLMLWAKGSAPLLDALITAMSLCAQWLLNQRRRDSWLWWIAVDVVSIPLYLSRGLPLIAVLYTVFLLLCIRGWFAWRAPQAVGATA
ncbi:nicotinamide riboside transporter PnuC [Jeongeupia naejangsanensis]|uniref:Nicotinamide riboside transporter PnuC n=1 Tax=Jeongeupia naejangsanensis TaxID=613195 RepID=A0ABS2BHJ4_9NEIS|nr:nicotinamide riboside transporter PnuC [Jeongeupia naejangsanensis]MBM3114935.1 nicotinamide mononucleotide transporter [Jeongeupia naejangsanensis]